MTGPSPAPGRVAVLIARAWTEAGAPRVRITLTHDIEAQDDEVLVTASEDEVMAIVRRWLGAVLEDRDRPGRVAPP